LPTSRGIDTKAAMNQDQDTSPDKIMELGLGFLGAKTLLSAIELDLFSTLAKRAMDEESLRRNFNLHPRASRDFLDALVALGMLNRSGDIYSNTAEANQFLDRAKPTYIGGILEMANKRLYGFWGSLTEALKTGQPQNEGKHGEDLFAKLYEDPARLKQFLSAMTGLSLAAGQAIAEKFPWREYKTFIDVGGAQGGVAVQIALAHSHLTGGNFDLPVVGPIFDEYARSFNLQERLRFHPGNFFENQIPSADVLIMGHILHDWDLEQKRLLIRKAYEALPKGGAFIVFEALIDDDRSRNAFGLLMSLNMLIETKGGFDFTGADGSKWMREAGFRETRVEPLRGPTSMIVGIK
jgi:hypothetical protein